MARPEVTGKKLSPAETRDLDAFSIEAFCRRHSISVPMFYKLPQQGLTPTEFRVGTRVLISKESAAAWRRERERAMAEENAA
jgi:hypothetical protein